jgi:hypothetical protein
MVIAGLSNAIYLPSPSQTRPVQSSKAGESISGGGELHSNPRLLKFAHLMAISELGSLIDVSDRESENAFDRSPRAGWRAKCDSLEQPTTTESRNPNVLK